MATQAVNTILQTIGGAERLQTGVAERVATKKYDEAMQQQQDRLEREQAALDAIAEIDAKDIAPTQVRAVQGEIDELNAKIGRGELDVNDINAEVARIKNNYNSYKSEWDLVKEDLKTKITDSEAFISMDEQGNETTKDVIRVYADQFLGDGVYTPESSMTVRASQGALMPHEEIDQKEMISTINNFYATNKDLFTSIGDIDPQLFYSKVTSGGLSNDEKTALTNYLKETYSSQLAKMASRRGYDREGFATGYIGSIIPQAQLKSEYAQAKETEEQKQRAKKRIEQEVTITDPVNMPPEENKMINRYYQEDFEESSRNAVTSRLEDKFKKSYEDFSKSQKEEYNREVNKIQKSISVASLFRGKPNVNVRTVKGDLKNKIVTYGGEEYALDQVYEFDDDKTKAISLIPITKESISSTTSEGDKKSKTTINYRVQEQAPILVNITGEKAKDLRKQAESYGVSFSEKQTGSEKNASEEDVDIDSIIDEVITEIQ